MSIDHTLQTIDNAIKEIARLREINEVLVAAAKHTVKFIDASSLALLKAAIAKAEGEVS